MALILHLDQDKKTTCFSQRCLQPRGHSVIAAADGGQAEVAMELRPDLLITNLAAPSGEDGAARAYVLEQAAAHKIPVIVLTAGAEEGAGPWIENLPKARFLRKPCTLKDLAGTVEELLPQKPG